MAGLAVPERLHPAYSLAAAAFAVALNYAVGPILEFPGERTDATFTHGICETCLAREAPAWKRA